MSTVFEPGKTYKTRDGRDALIYCVDAPGDFPVHGRIGHFPQSWSLLGQMCRRGDAPADLMPPEPERIDRTVWLNVFADGSQGIHRTAEGAQSSANIGRATRVAVPCRLVEIVGDAL